VASRGGGRGEAPGDIDDLEQLRDEVSPRDKAEAQRAWERWLVTALSAQP